MSEGTGSNVIGIRDVYDAVKDMRTEMGSRFSALENRIDRVEQRQDRNDGRLDMVKWLGPAGIAALILGVLVMTGSLRVIGLP